MFLTNFLNREITDGYRPFFEVIYAFEAFFLLLFPFVSVPIVQAAWRTSSYHRNIRMRIAVSCLHCLVYTFARLVMLHHQIFGTQEYVVVCSLTREAFIVYALLFVSMFSFDRWIAMKAWSWYERGSWSTFLLYCVEELVLLCASCCISFGIIFGYIPLVPKCVLIVVLTAIGPRIFVIVLNSNLRAIEESKRDCHSYSVARTFQLQENVAILTLIQRTAKPLFITLAPAFLFFYIYAFVPVDWDCNSLRYISIALYDLGLAITSVIIIICLPYYEKKFARNMNCSLLQCSLRRYAVSDVPRSNTDAQQVTNAYFDLLARHWENPV